MKQIIREEFQEFIGNAFSDPRPNRYNQHGGQPFQARGSHPRFGDPVCYNCGKRRPSHFFFVQSQILESLVMEMLDKILINREVEVVLIGILNRETEYCPCLVAKWSQMGASKIV